MRIPTLQLLAPFALVLAASCGGGGTPEDRAISTMEEVVTVLEGVESAEDVEAAKEKLEALGEQMKAIEEEAGGGEPDFTEEQKERFAAVMEGLMAEMGRVAQIEGAGALMDALETTDTAE